MSCRLKKASYSSLEGVCAAQDVSLMKGRISVTVICLRTGYEDAMFELKVG